MIVEIIFTPMAGLAYIREYHYIIGSHCEHCL